MALATAPATPISITRLTSKVPLPIVLMVLSFLCPTELSLFVAGLRLPPHRVALLILLVPAILRLTRGKYRLMVPDVLVLAFSVWTCAAYTMQGTGTEGLVYGGSVALEAFGSYIVARAWVRDGADFMAALKFLMICVIVAGLVALPEWLLGGYFTHDFLRGFVGGEPMPPVEKRMGLYRATSVFDHPIHLGTFCASLLALIWFSERRAGVRNTCLLIVCLATLTALSSAPLLCLGLQIGLIGLERATRGMEGRIPVMLTVVAGLYIGGTLVSNRGPIAIIATGFTIDSWTGYYRLMIWEHGLDNVWAHPLFGIGQLDWIRPKWMVSATIDAFWLVIAMRTGIPALLMVLAAIVLMVRGVVKGRRRRDAEPAMRRMALGWVIGLVALSMAATTVHLWNVVFAYYFFFLGLGGWIADPDRRRKAAASTATKPLQRRRYRPGVTPLPDPEPVLAGARQ